MGFLVCYLLHTYDMNVVVQKNHSSLYHELQLVGYSPRTYDIYRRISLPCTMSFSS